MPTAVITESSENTMSSSMICPMTAASDGATRAADVALLAFELLVNLARRLEEQEQAADDRGSGRGPRIGLSSTTVNSGAVRRMIQAIDISSRMRITIAPIRPMRRARSCSACRQLAGEDRDEDDVVDAEHDLEHASA